MPTGRSTAGPDTLRPTNRPTRPRHPSDPMTEVLGRQIDRHGRHRRAPGHGRRADDERQRPPPAVERGPPRRAAAHPPAPRPPRDGDHAAAGGHHRGDRLVARARAAGPRSRARRTGAGRRHRPAAGAPAWTPTAATSSGARTFPAGAVISTDPKRRRGDPRHGRPARRLQGARSGSGSTPRSWARPGPTSEPQLQDEPAGDPVHDRRASSTTASPPAR